MKIIKYITISLVAMFVIGLGVVSVDAMSNGEPIQVYADQTAQEETFDDVNNDGLEDGPDGENIPQEIIITEGYHTELDE